MDIHTELLAEHGGAAGVRDYGALEAALARPRQLIAYTEEPISIPALAAAVCVSILRNHPFIDGNKRTGFAALGMILLMNNYYLDATERDAAIVVLSLAGGEMSEQAFQHWVAANSYKI